MNAALRTPLKLLFPDQCVSCGTLTDVPHALCGACWSETPFIDGLACNRCSVPLIGQAADDAEICCDDCMETPPPWSRGRAALRYKDRARSLVLSLKHSDRLDLAEPMARWMAAAGADLLTPDVCLVPIPLHWTRLVVRRFNQSALLANRIAQLRGLEAIPDALVRPRRTRSQEGLSADDRMKNVAHAIQPHPGVGHRLRGRRVVLVDDVLTTGATLGAASAAAQRAGAVDVSVLVLSRVVKD